jgi:hypothetical protein
MRHQRVRRVHVCPADNPITVCVAGPISVQVCAADYPITVCVAGPIAVDPFNIGAIASLKDAAT